MNSFGFVVLPEEQKNGGFLERKYLKTEPFWIDLIQTIKFVEVNLKTPRYPSLAYCSLYYESHRARTEVMTFEALEKMFPKSILNKMNISEAYNLVFFL